jgi:carbonic anhydrase
MKKNIFLFIATFILMSHLGWAQAQEKGNFFGYEGGSSPMDWGELAHLITIDPYLCREGTHQSPIDINNVPDLKLENMVSDYSSTPIRILNNGHTIHLNYNSGSKIIWENKTFELIQFHFHSPSEHTINEKQYDMEMHLVHKTQDHKFLVIGVLMEKGKHNLHIQKLWDRIPNVKNKEAYYQDDHINIDNLLPSTKEYFYYSGSLTTPPCSENVSWFILKKPIEVSSDQINYFHTFISPNARPIQKLNNRIIANVK